MSVSPCPPWPYTLSPQQYTKPCSVQHAPWLSPQAAMTTRSPAGSVTRAGMSLRSSPPSPSAPRPPSPQLHRPPSSATTTCTPRHARPRGQSTISINASVCSLDPNMIRYDEFSCYDKLSLHSITPASEYDLYDGLYHGRAVASPYDTTRATPITCLPSIREGK